MSVPPRRETGSGLLLALASAATFGTSGAFGSSLLTAGWSAGAAVTARVVLAAVVLTPFAMVQLRGRWRLLRQNVGGIAAFGGVAVAACQLCYFNAVAHLSVGVALLLEYSGTVLVVGWLWLRTGRRPRRLTLAGGLSAVLGLVLILDLAGSHRLDPVGVLWGLGAAVGLAVFYVLSAAQDSPLPPLVLAWGGMVVGGSGLLVAAAAGVLPIRAPRVDVALLGTRVSWLVPVLWIAIVAAAVAYLAAIGAARRLGAKLASFVGLTEVLFAVLVSWLLLSQVPTVLQAVGGAFVLAGVALVRVDELGDRPIAEADEAGGGDAVAAPTAPGPPAGAPA